MTRRHQFPVLQFEQIDVQLPEKEDELLDILSAAKFLSVSASAMRRLQAERWVAFYKIGKRIRFSRKDLEAYVARRRIEAVER